MITGISVNGFKSLANFNLEFSKGINVLIGPNGSGKTNICQAIGLLSAVAEGEISNYILSMGGAKSVFRICSIEDGK
jgi:predicted ATPase